MVWEGAFARVHGPRLVRRDLLDTEPVAGRLAYPRRGDSAIGSYSRGTAPTAACEQCIRNSWNDRPPPTWPRNRRHRFSIDFREEIYYSTAMRRAIAIVARRMLRPNRKEVGRKG